MKKVESYAHACEITGEKPLVTAEDASPKRKAFDAAERIATVCEASRILNECPLDVANTDQWKYFPWHKINPDTEKPSGFGLSYFVCDFSGSGTFVGSRLTVGTSEEAEYIGSHPEFLEFYEQWNR